VKRIGISSRPASAVLAAGARAVVLAMAVWVLPANSWAATEVVLHTFTDTNTNENGGPISGLAADADGNLYGTTYGTGACSVGCGSVFRLTKLADGKFSFQTIYRFSGLALDGENPYGAPVVDSAGNVYGTTVFGGSGGVVYKLVPMENGQYKETVLHFFGAFGTNDGSQPYSSLVFDKAGNLYGTTNQGGGGAGGTFCLNGCGTVFKLAPNHDGSWTESVIHRFPGTKGNTDGQNPRGGLVFDSAGNLWGTTQTGGNMQGCLAFLDPTGCGTVFELTLQPDGKWKESTRFKFAGESTGFNPWDGLVIDHENNLYGMVTNGGGGNGAVFKLTPKPGGGVKEKIIHAFAPCGVATCPDGANPENGLAIDSLGNLYGTADLGGGGGGIPQGHGVVFKLTSNADGTWTEHILHRFTGLADGAFPLDDQVVVDSAGNVFGTAFNGGHIGLCPVGCGVVYQIKP